jgi:hypothetical protein
MSSLVNQGGWAEHEVEAARGADEGANSDAGAAHGAGEDARAKVVD